MGWYFKYHRIHFGCLNPFCILPPTDHMKEYVGAMNTNIPAGKENPPTMKTPTDNKGRWQRSEWKPH